LGGKNKTSTFSIVGIVLWAVQLSINNIAFLFCLQNILSIFNSQFLKILLDIQLVSILHLYNTSDFPIINNVNFFNPSMLANKTVTDLIVREIFFDN